VAAQREKRSNSNNDKMIQHPTREAEHQALLGSTGDFLLYSNIMHLLKSENMLSLNRSTTKIVKVKSTEQIIYEIATMTLKRDPLKVRKKCLSLREIQTPRT